MANGLDVRRIQTLIFVLCCGLLSACQSDSRPPPRQAPRSNLDLSTATLLLKAENAIDRMDFSTASAYVDSLEQLKPGLPETQLVVAKMQAAQGFLDEAQETYAKLIQRGFDAPGLRHNAAEIAFRRKKFQLALELFRAEWESGGTAISAHAVGVAHERLGDPDSARTWFELALEHDANLAAAEHSLARWFEQSGEFDQAITHADRALQLDPANDAYRDAPALLRSMAGRDEEAVPMLEELLRQDPTDYSARFSLSRSLQRMGRGEEADVQLALAEESRAVMAEIERLRSSVEDLPANDRLRAELAERLRSVGLLEEALVHYAILEHRLPGNLDIAGNVATLYLQTGDSTSALERYRRILSIDSTHVETWLNLGHFYARTNRRAEAVAAWRRAIAYGPDHPGVRALQELATPGD